MSTDKPNPYAAPTTDPTTFLPVSVDPASLKKIEAIIKDASQFWLAILMCLFCTCIGSAIIGPWYLARLVQWHSMAKSQPALLDPHVPPGSLPHRFQGAKLKLIIGMSFGVVMFLLGLLLLATTLFVA